MLLVVCLLQPAAHGRQLASDEVHYEGNAGAAVNTRFADYPMLGARIAPSAAAAVAAEEEALQGEPGWDPWDYLDPWNVSSPGPWWEFEEVGGPHAALLHAEVGDAAPYTRDWEQYYV